MNSKNPNIILYIIKIPKLNFFKKSNKNLITKIPTKKDTIKPNPNSSTINLLLSIETKVSNPAPKIAGIEINILNFTADILSTPQKRDAVKQIPDLLTPGIKAKH